MSTSLINKKPINVGVIFGGKSVEHEGSIQSAKHIFLAMNKEKFNPILIGIDRNGKWSILDNSFFFEHSRSEYFSLNSFNADTIAIVPGGNGKIINISKNNIEQSLDVIFPISHGGTGEDGTMQGLLRLMNIPFVGAGVLGSALGMDKDITKQLAINAGVPTGKFLVLRKGETIKYEDVVKELGNNFFVKPASLGSSVGIAKIKNVIEFTEAIDKAFLHDTKLLLEEGIIGREIECSVLGNKNLRFSILGEVISNARHEFYSFKAKYIDPEGAILEVPAKVNNDVVKKVHLFCEKIFKKLECNGMARIDFFLKENGEILLNEINTIPGFTQSSMYPRLWGASGLSYASLIEQLIELAIEKFTMEKKIKCEVIHAQQNQKSVAN